MSYTFKWKPEITWFIAMAVIGYLVQVLTEYNFTEAVSWDDWRKILIAIVVGALRAAGGAFIAAFTGGFRPGSPSVPTIDEHIGVNPQDIAVPKLPTEDKTVPTEDINAPPRLYK